MDNTDRGNQLDRADHDPRSAAVTFVTTEHFALQGARSSTISESTSRANVFLGAVSGGLIALGLVATAARTGLAFYMFGLILLPTLAFVGLATFHRVLQTGTEDLAYARRIAQLRDYYFDHAPGLASYLLNHAESLSHPGTGDTPVAAIPDRRGDGRRDHWGTGRPGGGLLAALQAARGCMLGSEAAHDQSHASSGVGFG